MTNIKLVNHSSVLIQEGNNFILTDPWFEKPAFGSWFPVPPTSVHPVYLVALAKSDANFSIAISHGHDDHLDDDFLSLFPVSTPIIIPQYIAKGLKSRLTRLGFENIIEAPTKGVDHKCFKIKSYINMSISRDDAIMTFETPKNFIVQVYKSILESFIHSGAVNEVKVEVTAIHSEHINKNNIAEKLEKISFSFKRSIND